MRDVLDNAESAATDRGSCALCGQPIEDGDEAVQHQPGAPYEHGECCEQAREDEEFDDFWSRELAAGRCPGAGDSAHVWDTAEPPEWQDTSEWDEADWSDFYEGAPRTCSRCGESWES